MECFSLNKSSPYLLLCLSLNSFCNETSRTWASFGPEISLWSQLKDCGFGLDLSPSHAGSSPRLSFVWAEVPVHGFKFQSDINGFSMINCKIWKINKMCVSLATTLEGRKLYTTKQSSYILGISPHWELWWFDSTKNEYSSSLRAISIIRRNSLPSILSPFVSSLNHNSSPEDDVILQE